MGREGKGWEGLKAAKAFAKPVPGFENRPGTRQEFIFTSYATSYFSIK
jgi:hypothetical protein